MRAAAAALLCFVGGAAASTPVLCQSFCGMLTMQTWVTKCDKSFNQGACSSCPQCTAAPTDAPTAAPQQALMCQSFCSMLTAAPWQTSGATMGKCDVQFNQGACATCPQCSPSVNGDPFAVDANGNKVQFWIPAGEQTRLLACGAFELRGSTKSSVVSGDTEQWFREFVILAAGTEELTVGIANLTAGPAEPQRRLLQPRNREGLVRAPKDAERFQQKTDAAAQAGEHAALSSLVVSVEGQRLNKTGSVVTAAGLVTVKQDGAVLDGTGLHQEVLTYKSGSVGLEIKSATPSKFATPEMKAAHAHLNVGFSSEFVKGAACSWSGVLPEIWGLVPMSKKTMAMLQPPQHVNIQ